MPCFLLTGRCHSETLRRCTECVLAEVTTAFYVLSRHQFSPLAATFENFFKIGVRGRERPRAVGVLRRLLMRPVVAAGTCPAGDPARHRGNGQDAPTRCSTDQALGNTLSAKYVALEAGQVNAWLVFLS